MTSHTGPGETQVGHDPNMEEEKWTQIPCLTKSHPIMPNLDQKQDSTNKHDNVNERIRTTERGK